MRWVIKLCALQASENRYFLFEHPKTTTSWKMAEVKKVARMDGVYKVRTDMCMSGTLSKDAKRGRLGQEANNDDDALAKGGGEADQEV